MVAARLWTADGHHDSSMRARAVVGGTATLSTSPHATKSRWYGLNSILAVLVRMRASNTSGVPMSSHVNPIVSSSVKLYTSSNDDGLNKKTKPLLASSSIMAVPSMAPKLGLAALPGSALVFLRADVCRSVKSSQVRTKAISSAGRCSNSSESRAGR